MAINAFPCMSNLVILRKKLGGIRTCFDMQATNKSVVPDKYSLPTTEELTTHCHGSPVCFKLDLQQG